MHKQFHRRAEHWLFLREAEACLSAIELWLGHDFVKTSSSPICRTCRCSETSDRCRPAAGQAAATGGSESFISEGLNDGYITNTSRCKLAIYLNIASIPLSHRDAFV